MMYPGSVVLGINLHFRGFNQMSVPKLYNSELSSFTTIPKTEHLVNIFADYKAFMKKSEVIRIYHLNISHCSFNVKSKTCSDYFGRW